MDSIKIGIVEPANFSGIALDELSDIGVVELYNESSSLSEFIEDKHIIFVRLHYLIDDYLIKDAKKLKYICSPTTGLNHIQVTKNVKILSLKGEEKFLRTIRATPEHIFGLTLSLLRNYKSAFLNLENQNWDRDKYRGEEVFNNSVGIVGMGRIGKILARYFKAFGSSVYFYDIDENVEYSADINKEQSIEDVIDKSNIIVLSIDYRKENSKMFGKKYFKLLQGKYFVNASRGEVVNEDDLMDFIEQNKFKGVAIDVLSDETDEPAMLREFVQCSKDKNVIITPHIGGATYTSMQRTEEFIVNKLKKSIKEG